MAGMITDYLDYQHLQTIPVDMDTPPASLATSSPGPLFMRAAVDSLSTTSASFLASSSPRKTMSAPPAFELYSISPIKAESRHSHLFHRAPQTAQEAELLEALQESENRDTKGRKRSMLEMQASTVVAGIYNFKAQSQLQAAEESKRRKTGNRKMDGKAKYFSGDDFYQLCVDDDQRRVDEAAKKERWQDGRKAYAEKVATWEKRNDEIRARNWPD